MVALGYWLYNLVTVDPGWYTISADTAEGNSGNEFIFSYNVGATGKNAKNEKKAVTRAYTDACKEAYNLFTWEVETPVGGGIRYLSDRPNQTVAVDGRLYEALALAKDSRLLYMGPITAEYSRIFQYEEEYLAAQYDPAQNPEVMAYITQLVGFTGSADHIRLELLGNNQVTLHISDEYLAFARENGVEAFLDFGWMKNAFVADFLADALTQKGFTQGYLVSYDGFGRYLEGAFTLSLPDRVGYDIYRPGVFSLNGPVSTVNFRNYPLSDGDGWRYFAFRSGSIASVYVDPADGVCKSATDNLACYSKDTNCAQMVLNCAPLFLTEVLDEAALLELGAEGIHTIWAEGKEIRYTDSHLILTLDETTGYTKKHVTE